MNQYSPGQKSSEYKSGNKHVKDGPDEDLAAEAKQAVKKVTERVKEGANEAVNEVKEQATSKVRQQQDLAADSLESVGEALHESADRLRQDDSSTFAGFLDQAAARVDTFAEYLREQDIKDMIENAQHWARRNPVLFLGGSFVAGLVIARLMKSTGSALNRGDSDELDRSEQSSTARESSRFGSTAIGEQYGGSAFGSTQAQSVTDPGSRGVMGSWEGT